MTDINQLTEIIVSSAESEAAQIILNSEQSAESKRSQHQKRIERMLANNSEKMKGSVDDLKKSREKLTKMYTGRIELKNREKFYRQIISEAIGRINQISESREYSKILEDLIVEAAIGLDCDKAYINGSKTDLKLIDTPLLKRVSAKVKQLSGLPVQIHLSEEEPLISCGIVLKNKERRISYNNQIDARVLRKKTIIRQIIRDSVDKQVLQDG